MARRGDSTTSVGSQTHVVALGAFVWVGVIALANGASGDDLFLGVKGVGTLATIVAGIVGVVSLIVFLVLVLRLEKADGFPGRNRSWVAPLIMLAVLVLVTWRSDLLTNLFEVLRGAEAPSAGGPLPGAGEPDAPTEQVVPVAQARDLLVIAMALSAIGALLWFVRRHNRKASWSPSASAETLESELLVALDEMSLTLRSGDDPRTSVIMAYAGLESMLARHDLTRAPSETHTEHIRRALRNLRVPADPFAELSLLYEQARFSEQEVSRSQQQRAADALATARRALAVPA